MRSSATPGTHNKWAALHQAKIQSFRTVMTGELFSLLKEHSILADLLKGKVEPNDVFKAARAPRDLQRVASRGALFRPRARPARPDEEGGRSILHERAADRHRRADRPRPIRPAAQVVGDGPARADAVFMPRPSSEAGREAIELDGEQCFLAGIHEIAKRI